MKITTITSGTRKFTVAHSSSDNTVSIYDQTHRTAGKFQPHGQFVASYYVYILARLEGGLNMNGGVPAWQLTPDAVKQLKEWLLS